MTGKRNAAHIGMLGALITGMGCAVLPISASAQTAPSMNDQMKQLQSEIRKIQKQYQTQIQSLQKQLDDLKAAQAAPRLPHRGRQELPRRWRSRRPRAHSRPLCRGDPGLRRLQRVRR